MAKSIAAPSSRPKVDLVPPMDAEPDGVVRDAGSPFNGRVIYTESMIDIAATKAAKRQKLDDDGNPLYKKHPTTGEAIYPIYELGKDDIKWRTRRYVLNEQAKGGYTSCNVKRIYNFEMTPEERERERQKDQERKFLDELVSGAVDQGMSAGDVLAKIRRDIVGDAPEDSIELDVTEEVVAEAMASAETPIERPADEDGIGAVED